jgi:hypothetical protein
LIAYCRPYNHPWICAAHAYLGMKRVAPRVSASVKQKNRVNSELCPNPAPLLAPRALRARRISIRPAPAKLRERMAHVQKRNGMPANDRLNHSMRHPVPRLPPRTPLECEARRMALALRMRASLPGRRPWDPRRNPLARGAQSLYSVSPVSIAEGDGIGARWAERSVSQLRPLSKMQGHTPNSVSGDQKMSAGHTKEEG